METHYTNVNLHRPHQSSHNSHGNSKYQTPIKSPSPDQSRMNALTPTKVKYLKTVKAYETTRQNQNYLQTPHRRSTPNVYANESSNMKTERNEQIQQMLRKRESQENVLSHSQSNPVSNDYTKSLQQQIEVLTIQNRNLLKKIIQQQRRHDQLSQNYSTNATDFHNLNGNRKHTTSQIIQKIKQQYQQKINTLKIMIQQQIKEAIGVIEDMCEIFKHKISIAEDRLQRVQVRINEIKMDKIMKIQNMFNETSKLNCLTKTNMAGSNGSSPNSNKGGVIYPNVHNFGENSISDILCVSIPEEEEEQSKNYTTTITKMEEQIEKLKQTIKQTEKSYRMEKQYLMHLISDKDKQIHILREKLAYKQKYPSQQNEQDQHNYNEEIKRQLRTLQTYVNQLAQQLANSQEEYEKIVVELDEKNHQAQSMSDEINLLRDKIHGSEKLRLLLQEKQRFLEGNIQILQQQLKQRKRLLNQALISKTTLEKQRISKLTKESNKFGTQKNLLNLTSKIDKLLELEQQRELKEKSFIQKELNLIAIKPEGLL